MLGGFVYHVNYLMSVPSFWRWENKGKTEGRVNEQAFLCTIGYLGKCNG